MISLRKLRRIEKGLERASAELGEAYPTELQDWTASSDDMETVRNIGTAAAHIGAWIGRRERERKDPFLRSDKDTPK